MSMLRYLHTLRHLRPDQVAHLLLDRAPLPRFAAAERDAVLRQPAAEAMAQALQSLPHNSGAVDACTQQRADEVMRDRFVFLRHEEHLPEVDWKRRYHSHLWTYHLHYFDYAVDLARIARGAADDRLRSRAADRLTTLAQSWIAGTRPGRGDGWQPYPTSTRVLNWTRALLMAGDAIGEPERQRMLRSLAAQLHWIERRLERHLLANHLQRNLQALAVGGALLAGEDADRWLRTGVAGLWREALEQVLPDGVHFERSPMYHAQALYDLLETVALLRAAGEEPPAEVLRRLRAMADAHAAFVRPDGTLHLFNDAANGMAPDADVVQALAEAVLGRRGRTPSGAAAWPDGGYYGWFDDEDGERLLVDCGEPGPRYQPGHAHCDLLSFELDLAGRPVVVDTGVHGYADSPHRAYSRSTAAHSTLMLDGAEQSEVWGAFRMGRRARPISAEIGADVGAAIGGAGAGPEVRFRFTGEYTPYAQRRARHRRTIERLRDGWRVTDEVTGADGARVDGFLHLHPDFRIRADGGAFVATAPDLEVRIQTFGLPACAVEETLYFPEFGAAVPRHTLRMCGTAAGGVVFGYEISGDPRLLRRAAPPPAAPPTAPC